MNPLNSCPLVWISDMYESQILHSITLGDTNNLNNTKQFTTICDVASIHDITFNWQLFFQLKTSLVYLL